MRPELIDDFVVHLSEEESVEPAFRIISKDGEVLGVFVFKLEAPKTDEAKRIRKFQISVLNRMEKLTEQLRKSVRANFPLPKRFQPMSKR